MLILMVGVGQRCSGSYSSTKKTKAAIYIAMFLHGIYKCIWVLVIYCSSAYEEVVWWIFKKKKPLSMKVYVIMYLIRCCSGYVFFCLFVMCP